MKNVDYNKSEVNDLGDFLDAWKQDVIAAAKESARCSVLGKLPDPAENGAPSTERQAPDPEWVRGTCPSCGALLVSNSYYVGGKGYILVWECWERLGPAPTCDYRRVI